MGGGHILLQNAAQASLGVPFLLTFRKSKRSFHHRFQNHKQ